MKTSSSCPMCRRNFVKKSVWYDNNDNNDELNELQILCEKINISLSNANNKLFHRRKRNKKLFRKNVALKKNNLSQLQRQITLRQDIEYSRGYIAGLENGDIRELKNELGNKNYKDSQFIRGYHAGYFNRHN
jgi:hypothetical protein